MAINFPTSLDTLTNPTVGSALNSPSHAGEHSDANDAIEAIETKVGADASAVNTTHDFKLSGVATADKAVSLTGTEVLTNKTLTSPSLQGTLNGWISANESWTYASASTITVPSGAAAKYKIGDYIKWTQTTVKYGVITAVADTLLTIAVNTDYVVTNAAISLNYYSHGGNPIGFPSFFNFTSGVAYAGGTNDPTAAAFTTAVYNVVGRIVYVQITLNISNIGSGNRTFAIFNLPITRLSNTPLTMSNRATWNSTTIYGKAYSDATGTVTIEATMNQNGYCQVTGFYWI